MASFFNSSGKIYRDNSTLYENEPILVSYNWKDIFNFHSLEMTEKSAKFYTLIEFYVRDSLNSILE